MTKHSYKKYLLILILLQVITGKILIAQTKEELQDRKKKNMEEIENTTKILEQTKSARKENIGQIQVINRRIILRDQIINSIQKEIEIVDSEIEEKNVFIDEMGNDMEVIKKEYANLILFAYRNRNKYSNLMFIFAAENFNQAYKRMRYLKQFTWYRRQQAESIREMKDRIAKEVIELGKIRDQKQNLIKNKVDENGKLQQELNQKNRIVKRLKNKENELKKELEEKKRINGRIEKEIEEIIRAEAKRIKETSIYNQLTPQEKIISDNFMENRGRLPWPTEKGVITERFGQHQHPVLKGITIQNNGIDVTTVEGAEARALFDGVVSKVIAILGANYTVIIRHGNYLTVYQNLVNVKVKKGEMVKAKQSLGTIYTDQESKTTVIHIEIWKELQKQNPEEWLSKI